MDPSTISNDTSHNNLSSLFFEFISVMSLFNPQSAAFENDSALSESVATAPQIICEPLPLSEDELMLDHIIYTVLVPIVSSIGVFAAFICVIVFTRPQMKSSLNIYLAGLSLFDLVLLAMSLLIYPPLSVCLRQQTGMVCEFFWKTALVTYPVSLAAQTASVWTCVAITVDRFLAIQYPLKMRVWCTPAKALVVLSIIATLSFLYKMPSIFELKLDDCGRLVASDLRQNTLYIIIYNTYGYLLLLIVIPWTLMIILNVIVIRAVHHAYRIRRYMTKTKGRVDDKERRCTVMALVMLSTFILFNLLAGINNVIEAFTEHSNLYRFRIPIGNLLICVNSASNILIYSIFGRKFRRVCAQIMCPCLTDRGYQWLQPTIAVPSEAGDSLRKITVLMPELNGNCPSRGNSLRMVHTESASKAMLAHSSSQRKFHTSASIEKKRSSDFS